MYHLCVFMIQFNTNRLIDIGFTPCPPSSKKKKLASCIKVYFMGHLEYRKRLRCLCVPVQFLLHSNSSVKQQILHNYAYIHVSKDMHDPFMLKYHELN